MANSEPEADQKPSYKHFDRAIAARVLSLFGPYRGKVTLMLSVVLVAVGLGLLPPYFLKIIIDDGLNRLIQDSANAAESMRIVSVYSALTILVTLIAAGLTLLYGYLSVVIGQSIMCDLRNRLFTHLQSMSLRFFTSTRVGDIQTRLISDVQGVQRILGTTLTDLVSDVTIVVSVLIAMFIMDWRLTLLSIAMVPFFAVIGQFVGNFSRKVMKGAQEQTSELNSMMQETLSVSGVLLTKTTGRLDTLTNSFDVENRKLAGWQIKVQLIQYMFFGMIRLITSLAPALVYWLAAWLIFQGDQSITVGTIVAFTGLQVRLFFPLTGLLGLQVEILGSFALFERIFQYLDLPRDIHDRPGAKVLDAKTARGEVEFEDVAFSYEPGQDRHTLEGVSFRAEPGQLVALVGPSGAGKTTLTYLIGRFYDVDRGTVRVDGTDVRDLTMQSLSEVVGAVTQETYLMHTTIAANLRVSKPDATDEELVAACKAAAIHDHIAGLSEGYETVVGERGYKLSGGEKQRLAIARAILKNPRILILDEATSALDTRNERLIQNSLAGLMEGRTTFAIAHRLSTILKADLILVMQDGRVAERGRHEELIARDGLYRKLYNEQFDVDEERALIE